MASNFRATARGATTAALILSLLLLPSSPAATAASSSAIQKELNSVASAYAKLDAELTRTTAKQHRLDAERLQNQKTIDQKSAALRDRAGHLYKKGVGGIWGELLMSPDLGIFIRRLYFLERLGDEDAELVAELEIAQEKADSIRADLASTRSKQSAVAADLRAKRRSLDLKLAAAVKAEEGLRRQAAAKLKASRNASAAQRRQLEAATKGVRLAQRPRGGFGSFALPIAGPSAFSDTWGAPRGRGRTHQGTDVMAACGAPVVAVTEGVISRLMSGGSGGTMAYLRSTGGDEFFYAHLQGYSSGTSTGRRVSAGDVIGYNGNTGNARGGPCHVHFEYHPGGGRPVNPYPLLAAAR